MPIKLNVCVYLVFFPPQSIEAEELQSLHSKTFRLRFSSPLILQKKTLTLLGINRFFMMNY